MLSASSHTPSESRRTPQRQTPRLAGRAALAKRCIVAASSVLLLTQPGCGVLDDGGAAEADPALTGDTPTRAGESESCVQDTQDTRSEYIGGTYDESNPVTYPVKRRQYFIGGDLTERVRSARDPGSRPGDPDVLTEVKNPKLGGGWGDNPKAVVLMNLLARVNGLVGTDADKTYLRVTSVHAGTEGTWAPIRETSPMPWHIVSYVLDEDPGTPWVGDKAKKTPDWLAEIEVRIEGTDHTIVQVDVNPDKQPRWQKVFKAVEDTFMPGSDPYIHLVEPKECPRATPPVAVRPGSPPPSTEGPITTEPPPVEPHEQEEVDTHVWCLRNKDNANAAAGALGGLVFGQPTVEADDGFWKLTFSVRPQDQRRQAEAVIRQKGGWERGSFLGSWTHSCAESLTSDNQAQGGFERCPSSVYPNEWDCIGASLWCLDGVPWCVNAYNSYRAPRQRHDP